jgi:hypothetical protein
VHGVSLTRFVSDAELIGRGEERGARSEIEGWGIEVFFSILAPRTSLLNDCFVEAGGVDAAHWAGSAVVGGIDDPGSLGLWQECADGEGAAAVLLDLVRTEDGEWIVGVSVDDRCDFLEGELGLHEVGSIFP